MKKTLLALLLSTSFCSQAFTMDSKPEYWFYGLGMLSLGYSAYTSILQVPQFEGDYSKQYQQIWLTRQEIHEVASLCVGATFMFAALLCQIHQARDEKKRDAQRQKNGGWLF